MAYVELKGKDFSRYWHKMELNYDTVIQIAAIEMVLAAADVVGPK